MINNVILVGRVGKDAETYGADNKVAKFSLATSEKYKDKEGNLVENTEWHNIVLFGYLAETRTKWIKKGMLISVEGKIQTTSYEKNGEKRYQTQIIANDIKFLSKGNNESGNKEETDDLPF